MKAGCSWPPLEEFRDVWPPQSARNERMSSPALLLGFLADRLGPKDAIIIALLPHG